MIPIKMSSCRSRLYYSTKVTKFKYYLPLLLLLSIIWLLSNWNLKNLSNNKWYLIIFKSFWGRILLCTLGWPWTYFVALASLEFTAISCLSLMGAGNTGVSHHTQFNKGYFKYHQRTGFYLTRIILLYLIKSALGKIICLLVTEH